MSRILCLLLAIISVNITVARAEVRTPANKSAAQDLMDQAEKAIDAADSVPEATISKPIVLPGKKTQPQAALKSTPPGGLVGAKPESESEVGPVKIVEGTATSKTTLAPATGAPLAAAPRPAQAAFGGMAVKAKTPISSTGLPGLGAPAGAPGTEPVEPITIHAKNGVTEFVPVSLRYPNRIQTPFKDPQVVDFSATDYVTKGSDIYVVPKGGNSIGIYIRENRPDTPVIALTLVPKDNIPGVTILANIDGSYRAPRSPGSRDEEATPSSYEEGLLKLMRQVAQERSPSGFTESSVQVGAATIGPLRIVPEKQYSGSTLDIYRYRIINTSKESLELSEEMFYQAGVKAISFFPLLRLDPWQSTKAFIIAGKGEAGDGR